MFSHGINQTAEDVGILGYKNADIEKLLKKTSKCEICNETGIYLGLKKIHLGTSILYLHEKNPWCTYKFSRN